MKSVSIRLTSLTFDPSAIQHYCRKAAPRITVGGHQSSEVQNTDARNWTRRVTVTPARYIDYLSIADNVQYHHRQVAVHHPPADPPALNIIGDSSSSTAEMADCSVTIAENFLTPAPYQRGGLPFRAQIWTRKV